MQEPLVVDSAGLAALAGQLTAAGALFGNLPSPLRQRTDAVVETAGEFAGDLDDGAAVFALSWTAAFSAYGACCTLLAHNVGQSSLQLVGIDEAAAGALSQPG